MNERLAKNTQKISLFLLSLSFVLSPLFFLPLTTDYFQLNKQVLFLLLSSIALIFWLIHNFAVGHVQLTLSPITIPLALFASANLASTLINSPKNQEVWLTQPSLIVGGLIYIFVFSNLINSPKIIKTILHWLLISGFISTLASLLAVLELFSQTNLPPYLKARSFSLVGSPLALTSVLLAILPISLIFALKVKSGPKKLLYFLSSGLILSCLILVGYQLLPGKLFQPLLLPQLAGWSIATDTLKTKVFLGAGPNEFLNQFTQFKPLFLNRTAFWNNTFTASSNEYFNILTTTGIIGLTSFLAVIFGWLKLIKRIPGTRITATQLSVNLAVAILLLIAVFIPFTVIHWLLLFGFLAFSVGLNKNKALTKTKNIALTSNIPLIFPAIFALVLVVILGFSWFKIVKVYLAETIFNQSLIAANKNLANQTYNLQIKAIQKAPLIDRYHLAYSNTNLALANALSEKNDLTDQERQTIIQLVQQAIREARTAVQLNPKKASNWINLGLLYRQLINFAQNADQFSETAYLQAIQLDPANPALRLEFGGLLFALEKYEEAANVFSTAIQLKPDLPNSYYNRAQAFIKLNKNLEAYQDFQQIDALLSQDSPDRPRFNQEMKDLEAKLPKTPATASPAAAPANKELTQPSPLPQPPKNFTPIPLD